MKFAVLIAFIAVASGIKIQGVVTPGESVVEPDHANLPAPGGGPDPAYNRITGGPQYA